MAVQRRCVGGEEGRVCVVCGWVGAGDGEGEGWRGGRGCKHLRAGVDVVEQHVVGRGELVDELLLERVGPEPRLARRHLLDVLRRCNGADGGRRKT